MDKKRSFYTGLKCRECGKNYPKEPIYVCEYCFGPLEVDYDYKAIKKVLNKETIASRHPSMWRYRELLPLQSSPSVGLQVGFTPLIRANRLAERLRVRELWIKNDAVNFPTLSFKDRVVSVAMSSAIEFGFTTIGCASTGNLANSVAANAAYAGLTSYVFIPSDLEEGKIIGSSIYGSNVIRVDGTYDQINRLCSEIAGLYDWAFVNINFRPYYSEGSKTVGYEISEQLGWKLPDSIVVPMAGGSLINKIYKGFNEFKDLGFVDNRHCKFYGAQAEGCSPIVNSLKDETKFIIPVKTPETIAKSLAIGDPADGPYALDVINATGGYGENPGDDEIIEGIKLLAECEGIFAETAGGVVVGALKRLIETEKIGRNEIIVLCITGNGLKTREAIENKLSLSAIIAPKLENFQELIESNIKNKEKIYYASHS
ncbi:threonine synthase [candidate division KSB1 bacterium]|nr:threonine synthase [candidate division KSB1 bacterium]